jgi:glycosyltransferase involved in cell wall biosynthesis
MRLALVLPELVGGGAERVFLDIARGLVGAGVALELVTVRDGGALADDVPPGVAWHSLGGRGVGQAVVPLARHLHRTRPDVVMSGITHMNLATILAARALPSRPKVVVTHHNHLSTVARHAPSRRDRLAPHLARAGYRFADRIVSVSNGTADDLAAVAHLRRDRITVINNPVLYDRLLARAEEPPAIPWPDEPGCRVVLGVGRLTAQKDFPTLLRAVALLPEQFRAVVLGEGEERPALEAHARSLGIEHRVQLPGFVANPYPAFARADVFALSSRWEGLPTVLMEALAFPARIVATRCPSGPDEILAEGRWGTLVPMADPEALAAAIEASAAAPAQDRAEARLPYQLDTVVARYLELLAS